MISGREINMILEMNRLRKKEVMCCRNIRHPCGRMKMYLLVLTALVASVHAQFTPLVDPSVLVDIFGTPKPDNSGHQDFEQITIRPTESTVTMTNKDGKQCKCVPYYLCDKDKSGVHMNNISVTGWGLLDVRFGDDDSCQESVELCCTTPLDKNTAKPKPDPNQLKGCGYSNPKGIGVTIFGGTGREAQFGEFPWVVALLNNEDVTYVGVGVLIHPQVVMTVAHYAKQFQPGTLRIRAGEWDTQTVKEILDYQERQIQEIYIHEGFLPKSLKYDVALLRLQSPFELGEHINMACLPGQDESFDNYRECVSNGWGKNGFGPLGRYAVILKKVEQNMVPHERCQSQLRRTRLPPTFKLHSSFVCAGGEEGVDTCQGDGGAPLACPVGDNRYKLAGLVSWGIECGKKDVPAVFASVAAVRQWVDDRMLRWGYGTSSYNFN